MAASYSGIGFLAFLLLRLASCSGIVAYDGKLMSRICSGDLYSTILSDYAIVVKKTLKDLISNTPNSPTMDYYCMDALDGDPVTTLNIYVYGHGICTPQLSPQDCQGCLAYAKSELFKECTHSKGAQIQLTDCRLRYEPYKFRNDE